MDEIIKQIKTQIEINFQNIKDQIGFVEDTSIVIPREKLMSYFEFVTNKIA